MRKFFNVMTAFAAAGVCIFMTVLSLGADIYTLIYNLVILGVMVAIIFFSCIFGFLRLHQTAKGLDRASGKLIDIYKKKGGVSDITGPGTRLFEVEYLDRKYQEYLAYLRKTNSPCDIGDYIGEYEINNYTHRRLVEMVPDILTSLGILGTFVGLVWGLRGFDPVSYEAMASSITSLVDGIKVAFITSIYGITLSMAFSYWLRGALSGVSESLDNFLDKYYLCAVPPTDATAMNRVLSNQKKQIKATETMSQELTGQLAESIESQFGPAMEQLNGTMDQFTRVVTLQQKELLQNIAAQVTESMRKEFMGEFLEMRALLKDSNKVQSEYVKFLSEAQAQFQQDFMTGEREMTRAMKASSTSQQECLAAMKVQQEHLREFVDYMGQAMAKLSRINEVSSRTLEEVTQRLEGVSPGPKQEDDSLEELNERLDRLILTLERQQRQQQNKKGFFRSGR